MLYQSTTYKHDLQTALSTVPGIGRLGGRGVMITGATGLIGSFLVDMLLEYNRTAAFPVEIYALGRSRERLEKRFDGAITERLHLVEHDVNLPPAFDFPVDYLIHAASNAYPAVFESDPVGTVRSNVLGTSLLLDYAKAHGAERFLFVSSGEVYGQGDPSIEAFPEDYSGYVDPTQPRSCYPAAKRAAETLCVSYTKQYGLETVIVRPCHTYGPNATSADNRANAQFVSKALAGEDIVMNSRGTQMRSYCYVADCASALLTVLLEGKSGEAYNIANPDARTTVAGFAETVAKFTGKKVVFAKKEESTTPITYAVLESKKLSSLGWTGNYTLDRGIQSTIRTLQNEGK